MKRCAQLVLLSTHMSPKQVEYQYALASKVRIVLGFNNDFRLLRQIRTIRLKARDSNYSGGLVPIQVTLLNHERTRP